jgi:hypothetical protein
MNRALLNALRILGVLLVLAGCSHQPKPTALESATEAFDDLRIVVREEIKDPARAAGVAGIVDQLELLMKEATEARKAHDVRLRALIRDYDAPEEDFRSAFREFNEKKVGRQDRLLAMDQRVRSLTSAKEWNTIAKAGVRAFEAAVRAEQGM